MTQPLEKFAQDFKPKQLVRALENFCEFAAREGISIQPYREKTIQDFASYPEDIQQMILRNFGHYYDAVASIAASGVSLRDTTRSLWHLFKVRGLRPTSDFFNVITQDSVVELYLPNHIQWYRSMTYYDYTSYSLGDLICYPWNVLVQHDEAHTMQLMHLGEAIFRNEITKSVYPDLEPTISQEKFSEGQLRAKLNVKVLSPIMNTEGSNEAAAIVWDIELLSQQAHMRRSDILRNRPEAAATELSRS